MNRLCLMLVAFAMAGCMGEPGYDDVAELQSAVEEVPAPPPADDMKPISQYCGQACAQLQHSRDSMCIELFFPRTAGGDSSVYDSCLQASSAAVSGCLAECERMYGGGL